MKVLKLHHPKGHPYWAQGEYSIELPNGEFFDIYKNKDKVPKEHYYGMFGQYGNFAHMIVVKNNGIYWQICTSSSGGGKQPVYDPFKIIDSSEYDKIEYVGEKLIMSETLKQDLLDNDIKIYKP